MSSRSPSRSSSLGSIANFIVNSNTNNNSNSLTDSNRLSNNARRNRGERFARASNLLQTREDLRWLARHMYRQGGATPWFYGGLSVITNRFMKLNKTRNKWRRGVHKIRAAKKHRTMMRREQGRRS